MEYPATEKSTQQERKTKKGIVLGIIVGGFIIAAVSGTAGYFLGRQDARSATMSEFGDVLPTPTVADASPTVPAQSALPDFSKNPVQPKTSIDISTWETFEDTSQGIRFKYPREWGKPVTTYRSGSDGGYIYTIRFPNNPFFHAGGTSIHFAEPRTGGYLDFNGFGNKFFWKSPQEVCKEEGSIQCSIKGDNVVVSTGGVCEVPYQTLIPYGQQVMLLNRPDKTISGFAMGGSYLSDQYQGQSHWFCIEDKGLKPKEESINAFNDAVKQRKLDAASMKIYDVQQKVFETVESL